MYSRVCMLNCLRAIRISDSIVKPRSERKTSNEVICEFTFVEIFCLNLFIWLSS